VSKSKAANQTQEQELAEQIINDLKEWASVGNDNWNSGSFVNELHKQYWPKDCLGYRFSIHNKLWMQPIILKLLGQGRDGLAKRIEQLRDKLDEAVNAYNENLDSTNPAHLVDTGSSMHAGNLINALEAAKPYLGQPAEQEPTKASSKVERRPRSRKKTPPQLLKESRERQAAQELAKDPNITSDRLGKILGCDKSTVVRLKAWQSKDALKGNAPNGFIKQTKDGDRSIEAIDERE